MPLHVICPGCLKRFQVSARFAGMKGPCPNCSTIISIPKESVKFHDFEEAGVKNEKKTSTLNSHIPRLDVDFDPVQARRYVLVLLAVLSFAFSLGCIPMYAVVRSLIGIIGLGLAAFPLTLFGYHVMMDREKIFFFSGNELYRRAGIVATGYVILWLGLEYFLVAAQADAWVSALYFAAFAGLAAMLAHPLLELKTWDAFFHYCIFSCPVVLCRFLMGFGWFWESGEWVRYSAAPPPPFLPGM